jgi:hypothetical protein
VTKQCVGDGIAQHLRRARHVKHAHHAAVGRGHLPRRPVRPPRQQDPFGIGRVRAQQGVKCGGAPAPELVVADDEVERGLRLERRMALLGAGDDDDVERGVEVALNAEKAFHVITDAQDVCIGGIATVTCDCCGHWRLG